MATENTAKTPASLDTILDDVSAFLQYRLDEDPGEVAVPRELLDALNRPANAFMRSTPPTSSEAAGPPASRTEREARLATIAREINACTACPLHENRTKTVPGQGNARPEVVFIGEGPGADEDQAGLAFVGRAGQLLTRMIEAMGLTRDEVFICNVVKCRPPGNRVPAPGEMHACLPFLRRQLSVLEPRVIITLGATALNGLIELPKGQGITKVRGTWLRFEGVDLMPTFHPAYLLRNANMKKYVWDDLKAVLTFLGRPIPPVKKR